MGNEGVIVPCFVSAWCGFLLPYTHRSWLQLDLMSTGDHFGGMVRYHVFCPRCSQLLELDLFCCPHSGKRKIVTKISDLDNHAFLFYSFLSLTNYPRSPFSLPSLHLCLHPGLSLTLPASLILHTFPLFPLNFLYSIRYIR